MKCKHRIRSGQMRAASTPAYKEQEINALIEYYSYMLDKLEVKVELGKEINSEKTDSYDADVVVLAMGAIPMCPSFKGGENARSAFEPGMIFDATQSGFWTGIEI